MKWRRRGVYLLVSLFVSISALSTTGVPEATKTDIVGIQRYLEAAVKLGDYLLTIQDPETKSWSLPWDPNAVDCIPTFHAVITLQELTQVTGDPKYSVAGKEALEWWLNNMFLGDEDICSQWTWAYGGTVGQVEGWEKDEWDKCQGAFVSQYWPEKAGFEGVRACTVYLRDGVAVPARALVQYGMEKEECVAALKRWFLTDLEKKRPESDRSGYYAYMTVQTFVDTDGNRLLEIEPSYSHWGVRWQSALMNAQAMIALFELGMVTEADQLGEWLIHVMYDSVTQEFYQLFDVDRAVPLVGYASDATFSNANVAEALLVAYKYTSKGSYLDYALRVLNRLISVEAVADNNVVYFTEPEIYRTYKVIPALVEAYRLTSERDYLVYALAAADWIIAQMPEPFAGFADKNAWTVAEALEAILSVCELAISE